MTNETYEYTRKGNHHTAVFRSTADVETFLQDDRTKVGKGIFNTRRDDWTGDAESFEAAAAMVGRGWSKHAAAASRVADGVVATVRDRATDLAPTMVYGTTGFVLDVDRFMMGEPECVLGWAPRPTVDQVKVVRIVIGGGFLARVDTSTVIQRGIAVTALVQCLTALDRPAEIWLEATAKAGQNTHSHLVRLKDADEPLDIARLLFWTAHPGCHRSVGFRIRNHATNARGNMGGTVPNVAYRTVLGDVDLELAPCDPDDAQAPICQDTAQWVEDRLREIVTPDGNGAPTLA